MLFISVTRHAHYLHSILNHHKVCTLPCTETCMSTSLFSPLSHNLGHKSEVLNSCPKNQDEKKEFCKENKIIIAHAFAARTRSGWLFAGFFLHQCHEGYCLGTNNTRTLSYPYVSLQLVVLCIPFATEKICCYPDTK